MNVLQELQEWYNQYCDGIWEHGYGIRIQTLDNPGWSIEINLIGTDLEDKPFKIVENERSEHDWICCNVKDNILDGVGGSQNLEELLKIFLKWAKKD